MFITKILVCAVGLVCEERGKGDSNEDAFDRRKWIIILSIKEIKPESRSQSPCGKGENWKEICPTLQGHSD